MRVTTRTTVVLIAVAYLGAAACRPGDHGVADEEDVAPAEIGEDAEGVGARIPVEEAPRERRQLGPAGETVAVLRQDADPGVTVYDPPPDLSRPDFGVVYIPSGPPPAPASGAGDTVGIVPTAPPTPVPGGITPPADTMGVRRR